MERPNDREDEIDLLLLFRNLMEHFLVILLVTVVCGGLAYAYSRFRITPQYESMSSIYMLSKETTLTSLADLQIGAQLTNDYKIIVTSRPVLQGVVDKLGLDCDYKQLKKRLVINNPTNTRILTITIQDPDPVMAKTIVDTVSEIASEYIGDTMELAPPKVIETGDIASKKSSPSNIKNGLIGAFAGFLIICGFYAFRFLTNDSISTAEDVERYLGIPVLAAIPLREDAKKEENNQKLQKRMKRRH